MFNYVGSIGDLIIWVVFWGAYVLGGLWEVSAGVSLCGGLCTQVQSPEEPRGVGCPGAGVKGSFQMPDIGAGTELGSTVNTACDPGH